MSRDNIKEQALRMVESLPENATWDQLMYHIYVRQAIESGLKDSEAGKTLDVKEVRSRFRLSK